MGRVKDVTSDKRSEIVRSLMSKELSNRKIARQQKVSASTVDRIARTLNPSTSASGSKRKNCGRKRKTSTRTDRKIVHMRLEQRRAPVRILHRQIRERGVEISRMTVRRRLYEANLKCRRPAKKQKLTEKMRSKRLQWARFHQSFTLDYWEKVSMSKYFRKVLFY